MIKRVRARYSEGSLTPLAPLDLSEGEVVTLTVEVESRVSVSKEERTEKMESAADVWTEQEDLGKIRRALNGPKLSTDEWLKMVRKRRDASPKRITADEIIEMRDADRT